MIGRRIEKLMEQRGITRYRLSKDTGIPYTTLTQIITGRTKDPQVSALQAIADYFQRPLDYLLGSSASALIEDRMEELGLSYEELEKRTGIPAERLKRVEDWDMLPVDYEPDGVVDRLARALDLPFETLADAFARQEPPVYDVPRTAAREEFEALTPEELNFLRELQQEAAWHDFLEGPEERKRELIQAVKFLLRGMTQ
ncbi:MAG: helix-turn-helix domain-containing protein [Alicyclobacillus macrosporangiidus]|uniref:helix-turn-helix domain-containing protein n=1 Tax=Alicyclobacillus macrosporangiidus TaxID=392015 RepID=UPI0026F25D41|nr:helix-turn-helix domain-containing protein [Alicyclobacillus macrosporangiidus]MCL6598959.1 helix-turn-helix domain-containing protein [Alicyclobacillus macrosporangiidus]